MTNKKSSFLIKFIILSTLVLAFILVLLAIIFNNYSSSKDNKEIDKHSSTTRNFR